MLGGLLLAVVAIAWLAYLVPWFASRNDGPYEDEADPQSVRFSESMRILRDDIETAGDEGVDVSTPLTRKAALAELGLVAKTAARRRRIVLGVLLLALTGLAVASVLSAVAWWTPLIPTGLIAVFLGIARFSVVAMHRRLDARAKQVIDGWACEDTDIITLADDEESIRLELSMDLATEGFSRGSLWDPIPVTAPTYVSEPLVPRTVRTIDLSAPEQVVPTADALKGTQSLALAEVDPPTPRVVNE